ncbi:ABC transporter substrate-binding protein [Alkalihalobacillus sp. MEB130]|uniref:ABC transporter substrate-binding protein n=1 Tax=Alkalihalobacillus sp. MEB130 TaxID=2976704 RepID=UPI0028DF76DA|nr:ABC transporter substrate-binding protein [Alkalihalobacillus sp. MEB130]MDT8860765.1 ABC transporter substrate-binding protein [Alkalihalobacillus sp. MEB130]
MKKIGALISLGMMFSFMLSGCGGAAESDVPESIESRETNAEASEELTEIKQITSWFAQPDHGGQYAALAKGFYEEAGLDMTIESGGPQVSAVQIVASGEADFGMAPADALIAARDQGIPVVGLAAILQSNPQILLFHKDTPINDFSDLDGRTVYVAPGVMYWEYIQNAYNLNDVQEMAFTGQFGPFIADEESVSQAFVTTAPYNLAQEGVEVDYLFIDDSGYETYANVLFTTEDYIEENYETVKAYIEASLQGWDYYKTNYDEINPVIQEANPDYDLEAMAYGSEALIDLIYGSDAAEHGVGYMSEGKWSKLLNQLKDIGIVESNIDVTDLFTTEFLPNE